MRVQPRQSAAGPQQRWFIHLPAPDVAIWLGLALSVLVVYTQTGRFDFVNYDDNLYVYQSTAVRAGLTPASIRWAFTAAVVGHWVPLTLLSHVLVSQFFQLQSGMHHLTNVLFHLLASILLFAVLKRSTGDRWPSAFVAFVFALHPLHVESVAWVSERKDVLGAFLWFLALYAYVFYAEKPRLRRYLLMAMLFCLALLSKPMAVTFPFTLILLDFWPLRRAQFPRTLWEKLPLVALSAVVSVVTYMAHQAAGFVQKTPLGVRAGNVVLAYVTYIKQMFWPRRLSVFYPYLDIVPVWAAVSALAAILVVSVLAVAAWRTRPYFATGWFWYLGTLVPVIGLVRVGGGSHADHLTYIPMLGLTMILAWGVADVLRQWPRMKPAIAAAAVVVCAVCMALAWKQTGYWRNCETLYQHAIEVTGDNWLAEANLGDYMMNVPDGLAGALQHLENALRIKPDLAEAHNNVGLCLARYELCGTAIPHFETALRIHPGMVVAHNNLGLCLTRIGQYGAAIEHLVTALRLQPNFAAAHFNLATALSKLTGRENEAIAEYQAGLRVSSDPTSSDNAEAHRRLGELFLKQGRTQEALVHFAAAQQIRPDAETSDIIQRLQDNP